MVCWSVVGGGRGLTGTRRGGLFAPSWAPVSATNCGVSVRGGGGGGEEGVAGAVGVGVGVGVGIRVWGKKRVCPVSRPGPCLACLACLVRVSSSAFPLFRAFRRSQGRKVWTPAEPTPPLHFHIHFHSTHQLSPHQLSPLPAEPRVFFSLSQPASIDRTSSRLYPLTHLNPIFSASRSFLGLDINSTLCQKKRQRSTLTTTSLLLLFSSFPSFYPPFHSIPVRCTSLLYTGIYSRFYACLPIFSPLMLQNISSPNLYSLVWKILNLLQVSSI